MLGVRMRWGKVVKHREGGGGTELTDESRNCSEVCVCACG